MRLKDVVTLVNEKTERTDKPYIALENIVSWDARFVRTGVETEGTSACFSPGDVLFGKLRPYLAKGYIPDYEGICSTEFLVMRPHEDVCGRYLLYWLLSPDFIGQIRNQVAGVKMPRTDWSSVGVMEHSFPSLDIQRRIVAYLDEKTKAIDGKVAVLEKKLAAYKRLKKSIINQAVTRGLDPNAKLKDSGVDWIGQVPEEWKIWRGKDALNLKTDVVPGGRKIGLENIEGFSGRFLETDSEFEGEGPCFRVGDIVYGKLRPYLCKVWLAEFNGSAVGDLFVYAVSDAFVAKYCFYTMLSSSFTSASNAATYGTKMPRVSAQYIDNLGFPVPPLAEQQAIADYLDAECAKIDRAAEIVSKQIDAYKRLKRSLINEVVTGKRNVA